MSLEEIKKQEHKLYKKYGTFFILGILLIALGWKWKSVWANILVISGGVVMIISLHIFSALFDNYYKIKGKLREEETGEPFKETYIEWPRWVKKYGWLLYFIAIIPGYYFAKNHENDFGGNSFLWHSILAGIFFGAIFFSLLKFKYTNWSDNQNKKNEIAFYILLISVILFVCLGPVINKYFAEANAVCNNYQLNRKGKNHKTGTKYIHVQIDTREERFNPPNSFFNMLTDNDSIIILCVRKGFLGYNYVEEFKLSK